jgi:neutral amino acid transport system substrate-binding protein
VVGSYDVWTVNDDGTLKVIDQVTPNQWSVISDQ